MQVATEYHDPFIGLVVGDRYALRRRIGRGGMGKVFLAESTDSKDTRKYAVKLLLINRQPGRERLVERFKREAQTLADLDHPNIVRYHASGNGTIESGLHKTDYLYLVMNYIGSNDGENQDFSSKTLDDLMAKEPLPPHIFMPILRELSSALAYVHDRKLIHRDVKPQNILIGTERSILADFGIAKSFEGSDLQALTPAGYTIMTEKYAAPEQFQPGANISPQTDIYAVGLIAYQCLCGKLPGGGRKGKGKAYLIEREELPSRISPHAGGSVDQVICRALEPNPDRRYTTIGKFMSDLETGLKRARWERLLANPRFLVGFLTAFGILLFLILRWTQ